MTMLKPVESETREIKCLDGLWRFVVDKSNLTKPWSSALPGDLECPVPASYNDIFVEENLRHVGKVWYQRQVRIPRGWTGQKYFI
jgi:beta-glucuronidase